MSICRQMYESAIEWLAQTCVRWYLQSYIGVHVHTTNTVLYAQLHMHDVVTYRMYGLQIITST